MPRNPSAAYFPSKESKPLGGCGLSGAVRCFADYFVRAASRTGFGAKKMFGGTSFWVHDSSKLPTNLRSAEALLPWRP